MSTTSAYDAFALQAGAFAAARALPVSFPGLKFDPPDEGQWLEVSWVPGPTQNYGLADNGPSLLQGLAQVSVCERPGAGIARLAELADEVIAAFAKGTEFDTVRVYRRPYQSGAITDPARVMVPVTIMWQGFAR